MTEKKKTTIFEAVALAIGEVKQLGKSERNKFDGYDFVSIDKFLALVNPICAAHGLFPHPSQTNVELYENTNSKGGKSMWARFYFDITLHHSSGEALPPSKIMVAVPMNGAQASGSAQSYALKQFFRGMFMIPTGDKDDADFAATEQHTAPPLPSAGEIKAAVSAIEIIESMDELQNHWVMLNNGFKPIAAHKDVIAAKETKKAELSTKPSLEDDAKFLGGE
jgi:hypothetical protein